MGLRERLVERWSGQASDIMETRAAQLRETMNDLEMQLLQAEELGWLKMSGSFEALEFSWEGRQRMNELAFLYWFKNPMAGRAVATITNYVFGRGVGFRAKHERVNQVLQEFLSDEDNKAELATAEAQRVHSDELQVFGNVFFVLFAADGKVKVSSILDREVQDVILDPDNRNKPLMYKRAVTPEGYDYGTHAYSRASGFKYIYYPDWRNRDDEHSSEEADGACVRHVRTNRLGHMKFGTSEIYRAMDWLRAYNKFLEDWASITAALARFAWKKKMKGGPAAVAAAAQAAQSGLATSLGVENNPPSAAGATIFENMGSEATPIRTAGATTGLSEGRQLRLMSCSAFGVMDHYLSGDPSTGNLATACHDEETEFLSEQGWKSWQDWRGERVAVYDPNTGELEYEVPRALLVYDHAGDLIHFTGKSIDCAVTPNHRMWVQLVPSNQGKRMPSAAWEPWQMSRADGLIDGKRKCRWLRGALLAEGGGLGVVRVPSGGAEALLPALQFLRFLGYFIADGSAWKSPRGYKVELGVKIKGKADSYQEVCDELDFHVTRSTARGGMQKFVITNKDLALYLADQVGQGATEKRIPSYVWGASRDEKVALWQALLEFDGHDEKTSGYYSTSSKGLADDVQRLLVELGYATRLKMVRQKLGCSPEYIVHWRVQEWQEVRPCNGARSPYKGKVWCFSTSTGIFVTRRNGAVAIHGNTAMELPMLKDFESRQEIWAGVYRDILGFVVEEAGLGNLKPEEREIEVIFPNIIQKDTPALIKSIVESVNLGLGGNTSGLLPMKEATALVVDLLGVENPDKVLSDMYPEGAVPASAERDFQNKAEAVAESVGRVIESMGGI